MVAHRRAAQEARGEGRGLPCGARGLTRGGGVRSDGKRVGATWNALPDGGAERGLFGLHRGRFLLGRILEGSPARPLHAGRVSRRPRGSLARNSRRRFEATRRRGLKASLRRIFASDTTGRSCGDATWRRSMRAPRGWRTIGSPNSSGI